MRKPVPALRLEAWRGQNRRHRQVSGAHRFALCVRGLAVDQAHELQQAALATLEIGQWIAETDHIGAPAAAREKCLDRLAERAVDRLARGLDRARKAERRVREHGETARLQQGVAPDHQMPSLPALLEQGGDRR